MLYLCAHKVFLYVFAYRTELSQGIPHRIISYLVSIAQSASIKSICLPLYTSLFTIIFLI